MSKESGQELLLIQAVQVQNPSKQEVWLLQVYPDDHGSLELIPDFVQGLCLLQKQRGQKKSPGVLYPGDFVRLEYIEMVL